ncbi:MAG: flagellar hook assembly protein FlgD [Rhodobacteraceae bacterium]|nr:flagellar hook assembly protein FlgD [Paracoccaceae bacterium]
MDAVTTASASTAAAASKNTQQQGTLINSDFQTFLLMLTTQMQNQDPLNPIDSTEYAQQLATFSGVEQQVRTNTLLGSLNEQFGLSGMAQMASWVGMEARVTAPVYFANSPLTLYPAPAQDADQAVLVAYDAQGREVTRNAVPVSADPIVWAGTDATGAPLASGSYSFRLESYQGGEMIGSTEVETYGRIGEVRQGPEGVELVLEGGASIVPSDVHALRAASS